MSNPNNRPGYRGNPTDPRLSQQGYGQRPMSQHLQSGGGQPRPQQQGQRIQSYGMDQLNRPRPPPHNRSQQQQQQQRSSRTPQGMSPQQQQQQQRASRDQQQYQSSRQQGGRPMRPPSNYANANPTMGNPHHGGQGPYRRVSMNRSRSLSRPERQRPRTGMIRSPSQQQRMNQQQRYGPNGPPNMRPRPNNQPMPNRLQHQLQQQKLYQQQEALLDQPTTNQKKQEIPEEKVKVLTSWWAWLAFLMTCCIPNWFLRACLKKKNAMVQQAWREKVKREKELKFYKPKLM